VRRTNYGFSNKAAAGERLLHRIQFLICNPFCGRMRCDAEPYDLSSAVPATVAFKSLSASEVLSNPFRLDVYAFDWASNRVAGRAL
jgi:hypothetical protein